MHAVPQQRMAKLMRRDPRIIHDPDRGTNLCKRKDESAGAVARRVAKPPGIDGTASAPVVNGYRKTGTCGRAIEKGGDREAHLLHHAEETIHGVVGAHG